LAGTGGNTGAQTVSTIIRGLALKEIRLRDTMRIVVREFCSGLLLRATLGLIAFGRAELWGSGFQLSLVVALSILAICAWPNTIGSLIPLVQGDAELLRRLFMNLLDNANLGLLRYGYVRTNESGHF
jgi:magnesium transporter